MSGWRRGAVSRGRKDHFSKSFSETSAPLLMDPIRVSLWSFKNKWELMWKTYFFLVALVLAILGKISLPCFPELSWAGVRALSVSNSSRYYSPIPASQEPVFLLPDVRPLLPPAHLTSQKKKNLFQRTCRERRLLSAVNSLTLLDVVVHLLLIIVSGSTWDVQQIGGFPEELFPLLLTSWV